MSYPGDEINLAAFAALRGTQMEASTPYVMDWMQILTGDPHAGWEAIAAAYA